MKYGLPPRNRDLKRYALGRRILQIVGYVAWIGGFLAGALLYNDAHQTWPPERRILGWRLVIWMLVAAALGFFLFRIWTLYTRRSLSGVILESGLSQSYSSSADPGMGSGMNFDFRTNTYLVIRTDRGKRRRVRFEQKSGFYIYYYPGNRLHRFAGLPYPLCDTVGAYRPKRIHGGVGEEHHDDLSRGFLCVACGYLNNWDCAAPCGKCGHSLVDPRMIWKEDSSTETLEHASN